VFPVCHQLARDGVNVGVPVDEETNNWDCTKPLNTPASWKGELEASGLMRPATETNPAFCRELKEKDS